MNYKNHIVASELYYPRKYFIGTSSLGFYGSPIQQRRRRLGLQTDGGTSRCQYGWGRFSLCLKWYFFPFAFVKVAQPTDQMNAPSFLESVRTHGNDQIEPIDSLQTKFDLVHSCNLGIDESQFDRLFNIYPNPIDDFLIIEYLREIKSDIAYSILQTNGKSVLSIFEIA